MISGSEQRQGQLQESAGSDRGGGSDQVSGACSIPSLHSSHHDTVLTLPLSSDAGPSPCRRPLSPSLIAVSAFTSVLCGSSSGRSIPDQDSIDFHLTEFRMSLGLTVGIRLGGVGRERERVRERG